MNIQFGGIDTYSGSAIMKRVVDNIKAGKYIALTESALSVEEQLGILEGLVQVINNTKAGGYRDKVPYVFMDIERERICRTYPVKSTITSVFLEDYFLAFEIFNDTYLSVDGEEKNASYRKIVFEFLRRIIVDGIYNNGDINKIYLNFYPGVVRYLQRFSNIFTTNYDYNLESALGDDKKVCHLHGEFGKLDARYRRGSKYYMEHKAECEELIAKQIPHMDHIYSDAIMSWSWLDKYDELFETDSKDKMNLFKNMGGQLEIVGLAPANDEHLFIMINQNPNIKSVMYCKRSM